MNDRARLCDSDQNPKRERGANLPPYQGGIEGGRPRRQSAPMITNAQNHEKKDTKRTQISALALSKTRSSSKKRTQVEPTAPRPQMVPRGVS